LTSIFGGKPFVDLAEKIGVSEGWT
jgi:hypothetical protein